MRRYDISEDMNKPLVEKIKFFRERALKNKKKCNKERLEQPISFWIKKERLINEIGKEFTIILRTRGCSWALGETGGCSMCGYIEDAAIEEVDPNLIKKQFDSAYNNKVDEIKQDSNNYVLKIFNSGSFLDDNEVPRNVRRYILEKIANINNVKELVIESRLEYITSEKLEEFSDLRGGKYVEIGIGLETVNDYIRNNYINKGFLFNDFKSVLKKCKQHYIGVKAYLLFKPPFINEQGAIDDCSNSIKTLLNLGVNSISINPLNVQRNTLVERLWYQNRYRPPWFYSLFKCFKKSLKQKDLNKVRLLCDPSGAGTKRGIHNCLKRECETSAKKILSNFTLNQELIALDQEEFECNCKKKYQLQKRFF